MESLLRVITLDHSHFEVFLRHFSLKGVLQSFDSRVYSVTDVDIITVSLLEEAASLFRTLAKCGSFPAIVSA